MTNKIDILGYVVPALLGFDFLLLFLMTIFLILKARRKEQNKLLEKEKKANKKKKDKIKKNQNKKSNITKKGKTKTINVKPVNRKK